MSKSKKRIKAEIRYNDDKGFKQFVDKLTKRKHDKERLKRIGDEGTN